MYTIGLCLLIALFIWFFWLRKEDYKYLTLFALLIIALLISLFVSMKIMGDPQFEHYFGKPEKLASLKKGEGVSGNFFLGNGIFQNYHYYYYYQELEDGGLQFKKIKTEHVTIYEQDRTDAVRLDVYRRRVKKNQSNWVPNFIYNIDNGGYCKTIFRIPKGSVIREYSVKL